MGKKGPSKHLKREQSPKFWPIHRKEDVWAVKPSPGPHAFEKSMPLLVVVRDLLDFAETGREAKMIIKQGKILVDGKPRRDERYPLGIMDVVELPDGKRRYRALPFPGGKIRLNPIDSEEAAFKLCQILGKTTIKKGETQLNLHDGRNIVLSDVNTEYMAKDVLKISVPEQEILDTIRFEKGVIAIITGGRLQGRQGIINGIGSEPGWKRTATISTSNGEDIRTLSKYVFPIGSAQPLISTPNVPTWRGS